MKTDNAAKGRIKIIRMNGYLTAGLIITGVFVLLGIIGMFWTCLLYTSDAADE